MGLLAGYCFAVSLRLAILGLSVTLAMLIAQGLFLPTGDADAALLYGMLGGLTQVAWSLVVWLARDRNQDEPAKAWSGGAALAALRANLTLSSLSARHALRFGAALAAGVAAYRLLDLHQHGFWIPLTILFVMRPERDETYLRLVLRAAGTVLGLTLATVAAGITLLIAFVLVIAGACGAASNLPS